MLTVFVDQNYRFPALGGGESLCEVRIYATVDRSSAVVVMIEDDRNFESTSIVNAIEVLVAKIQPELKSLMLEGATVRWMEVNANLLHEQPTFDWVKLEEHRNPVWRVGSRAELEALIDKPFEGVPPGDERHPIPQDLSL
jgi:hypothetical protein